MTNSKDHFFDSIQSSFYRELDNQSLPTTRHAKRGFQPSVKLQTNFTPVNTPPLPYYDTSPAPSKLDFETSRNGDNSYTSRNQNKPTEYSNNTHSNHGNLDLLLLNERVSLLELASNSQARNMQKNSIHVSPQRLTVDLEAMPIANSVRFSGPMVNMPGMRYSPNATDFRNTVHVEENHYGGSNTMPFQSVPVSVHYRNGSHFTDNSNQQRARYMGNTTEVINHPVDTSNYI